MHKEFEASPSQESSSRRGRWTRSRIGGREQFSREALEREAEAEMGLTGGFRTQAPEAVEAPEAIDTTEPEHTLTEGRPARGHRAREQWTRLRGAWATESDAARRERLEREAVEEMGLGGWSPEGSIDKA